MLVRDVERGILEGYFLNFFVADIHASKHGMSISKLRRVEYYSLFNYNYKYNLKKMFEKLYSFLKLQTIQNYFKISVHY